MIKMSVRARGWCMTLNNYTEDDVDRLSKWFRENCEYACIGREIGSNGTPHLQICCEFKNMKSFKQMKDVCPEWHVEKRKGTKFEAAEYCKKDGDYKEIGDLGNEQGKRTDLSMVRDMVKEGKNMRSICDVTNSYQAIRYAETLRKYYQKGRNWKPKVYWYWGPTGTGKTRLAMEQSDENDRWVSLDSFKWWEGYDGQADVIVDDFRGSDCRLKTLLRILDRYEYKVENKGGSTQLLAKNIWITCPYHPNNVYKRDEADEDMKQLLRRIDVIIEFDEYTFDSLIRSEYCDRYKGMIDCDSDVDWDEEL